MKDRKKRKQREEVRRLLHAVRLELAAQRAAQARHQSAPLKINELFWRAKKVV